MRDLEVGSIRVPVMNIINSGLTGGHPASFLTFDIRDIDLHNAMPWWIMTMTIDGDLCNTTYDSSCVVFCGLDVSDQMDLSHSFPRRGDG